MRSCRTRETTSLGEALDYLSSPDSYKSGHRKAHLPKSYKNHNSEDLSSTFEAGQCSFCIRQIGETWQKVFKEKSGDILQRAIELRKGPTMERIERPSRLDKARMFGYKAKEGVVVIRIKIGAGGMRRPRPVSGRRPKHLGVLRMKSDEPLQKVAERRVREKHANLKLLGSYLLWVDGKHRWYEMHHDRPRCTRR